MSPGIMSGLYPGVYIQEKQPCHFFVFRKGVIFYGKEFVAIEADSYTFQVDPFRNFEKKYLAKKKTLYPYTFI